MTQSIGGFLLGLSAAVAIHPRDPPSDTTGELIEPFASALK